MVLVDSFWVTLVAALLGGYAFVFGFVRRMNEWYYVSRLGKMRHSLPPGDLGWPFLGNMLTFLKAFKSDPDSFIHDLISRYGRRGMYKMHLFGNPSIIVCNPEACRKLLTDDEQIKLGYPASTQALLEQNRSLQSFSNEEHKRIRRLIADPVTGHEALSLDVGLIEGVSMKWLQELSSKNTPYEFLTEMKKFTFEVFSSIFMGSDAQCVDFGMNEKLFTDLHRGLISLAINLPGFRFYKAFKAQKKLTKQFQELLKEKRSKTLNTKTKMKKDMIDLLMETKDEDGTQLEDEDITGLIMGFFLAGHGTSSYGILWTIIYLMEHPHVFPRTKAQKKLIKRFRGLLEEKRSKTLNQKTKMKKDMIDLLMETKDEDGTQLEDEDITGLIMGFFLVGHETSAYGILWTIIHLMEHPHVFQRAKVEEQKQLYSPYNISPLDPESGKEAIMRYPEKEQEEIMERRPSTQKGLNLKEIKQMGYLSKVINEMLRITSIAFATFRQAKVDLNINGYTIPKGWKVLVWNRAVHMDPEIYQNPKEFDPSRWDNHKARAGSFLPFGLGSRLCPGADLAKLEISIFVHNFLLNYRMERINPECPISYLPNPRPIDNCLARIIRVT